MRFENICNSANYSQNHVAINQCPRSVHKNITMQYVTSEINPKRQYHDAPEEVGGGGTAASQPNMLAMGLMGNSTSTLNSARVVVSSWPNLWCKLAPNRFLSGSTYTTNNSTTAHVVACDGFNQDTVKERIAHSRKTVPPRYATGTPRHLSRHNASDWHRVAAFPRICSRGETGSCHHVSSTATRDISRNSSSCTRQSPPPWIQGPLVFVFAVA